MSPGVYVLRGICRGGGVPWGGKCPEVTCPVTYMALIYKYMYPTGKQREIRYS